MAMLAGPRRKQKFSLNPRGNLWSDDDTKFGQKLMEKMGWSKGKGLGANENGRTEHVGISKKNDNRGVGCSKNQADNWIAHQDDFNSLLANLNQDHGAGEASTQETKVLNLEERSKTSKGRLHYQKFTKGKDLSLKSETDLHCVFGKRKSQSGNNTPQTQSEPSSDTEDNSHGIHTVTSTDSIQDYFKRKMAERLNKLTAGDKTGAEISQNEIDQETDTAGFDQGFGQPVVDTVEFCELEVVKEHKKKKKSKKRKLEDDTVEEIMDIAVEEDLVPKKVKKSKRKKKCDKDSDDISQNEIGLVEPVQDVVIEDADTENIIDNVDTIKEKVKKEKKSKRQRQSKESSESQSCSFSLGEESEERSEENEEKELLDLTSSDKATPDSVEETEPTDDKNKTLPNTSTEPHSARAKKIQKKSKKKTKKTVNSPVFPGSNLHNIRGYYGLSDTVVNEGLAAKQKKRKFSL